MAEIFEPSSVMEDDEKGPQPREIIIIQKVLIWLHPLKK